MDQFRNKLATDFSDDTSQMPKRLQDAVKALKGLDTLPEKYPLNASDIEAALSAASLTLHEGTDGMVHIVDTTVHEAIRHSGGVSMAKFIEQVAKIQNDFVKISSEAPKVIVSTYAEEAVYG